MGIRSIKREEFNSLVELRFNSILEGFNNYSYRHLTPIYEKKFLILEKNFINTLECFFDLNHDNKIIVDFYKNRLNEDSIKILKDNLNYNEQILLDNILNEGSKDDIFFEVNDKRYIALFTKLCTRELFFITFYFTKGPITIWGNYNLKFPLFYCNEYSIQEYLKIARDNDLLY